MLNLISFLTVTSIALFALQLSDQVAGNGESPGVNNRIKGPAGQIAQLKPKVSPSKKVNIGGRTRTYGTPATASTSSYTATSATSATSASSAGTSSSATTSSYGTTIYSSTVTSIPQTSVYISTVNPGPPVTSSAFTLTTSYVVGTIVSSSVSSVTVISGQYYQQCYKDCNTGSITATGPTGAIIPVSSSTCFAIVTLNCPVALNTVSPTSTTSTTTTSTTAFLG
jgi:hypothetical protein